MHARATEDSVIFGVTDTGPGIPIEHRERIFDRQWRAADTAHLGHGLGLSIAKGIVEAHRGRIWLTNQESGGSAFSFSLPRA
jgi:signal transduction histidine kinase